VPGHKSRDRFLAFGAQILNPAIRPAFPELRMGVLCNLHHVALDHILEAGSRHNGEVDRHRVAADLAVSEYLTYPYSSQAYSAEPLDFAGVAYILQMLSILMSGQEGQYGELKFSEQSHADDRLVGSYDN